MIPTWLKVGAVAVVLLVVGAVLYTVRAELIEKGKNIIMAEDNAARVKAQEEQAARDKVLIASQNDYINDLQNRGEKIKETIKYVTVPASACKDDGRSDPRVGDVSDFLRRPSGDNGTPNGGPKPKNPLPAAGPTTATGRGIIR